MNKKLKFDYDKENDSLIIYKPNQKSRGSIEIGNIIIDFDSNSNVCALEILEVSEFLSDIVGKKVSKLSLESMHECKFTVKKTGNFLMFHISILLSNKRNITTPLVVPTIHDRSPALAYS